MSAPRFRSAVLTVSDTAAAGQREDLSGAVAAEVVVSLGGDVVSQDVVPDDEARIMERLRHYADDLGVALVLTTGGTGLSPRDVTPEATRQVLEREAPGLAELMRRETARFTPLAALSRAVCGLRRNTLIINLPGSPRGVRQCLEALSPVLVHGLQVLSGTVRQHESPAPGAPAGGQPS